MEAELVVSTNNPHKRREIAEMLAPFGVSVVTARELGLAEVAETGETFAANAILKAEAGFAHTGRWCLADDSGLSVEWLGGAPGVRSARYAGPEANDAANNRKLIEALAGVPEDQRGAAFVCAMALVGPKAEIDRLEGSDWETRPCAVEGAAAIVVSGSVDGYIVDEPSGQGGFGYDPHFFHGPSGCTFAELPADAKNAVSHRGKALRALREVFVRLSTAAGT